MSCSRGRTEQIRKYIFVLASLLTSSGTTFFHCNIHFYPVLGPSTFLYNKMTRGSIALPDFLDSSCYSVLYPRLDPTNHSQSETMSSQFSEAPTQENSHSSVIEHVDEYIDNVIAISDHPAAMRGKDQYNNPRNAVLPTVSSAVISRFYSLLFPGDGIGGYNLHSNLHKDLASNIIETSVCFIDILFPNNRLPFPLDNDFFQKMAKPISADHGSHNPIWDDHEKQLSLPANYTEKAMEDWFNLIAASMEHATHRTSHRVWSHRNCNVPPAGSSIKRKPDLMLIDKSYHRRLCREPSTPSDWRFIQAICETTKTTKQKCKERMTNAINAKSYVMIFQPNRRFVIALSYTGGSHLSVVVTDHAGQVRLEYLPLQNTGKIHARLFFKVMAFLMFGEDSNIGLDPNVRLDSDTGKARAISMAGRTFAVKSIIHCMDSLVGRATKVWEVRLDDEDYILKDSWVQTRHEKSEASLLELMSGHDALKHTVPRLICSEDVRINEEKDCTENYRRDLHGHSFSQRIHRRLVLSPIGQSLETYESKKDFISIMISLIQSMFLI